MRSILSQILSFGDPTSDKYSASIAVVIHVISYNNGPFITTLGSTSVVLQLISNVHPCCNYMLFWLICCLLTHWDRDKMDAISQTTCSSAFSVIKMFEFRLKFNWSLFLRVQLTIIQHCFRWWLDAVQATSHYLNQWCLVHWRIYASLGLNESTHWSTLSDVCVVPQDSINTSLPQWPILHAATTYVISSGISNTDGCTGIFLRVWSAGIIWPKTYNMYSD